MCSSTLARLLRGTSIHVGNVHSPASMPVSQHFHTFISGLLGRLMKGGSSSLPHTQDSRRGGS